MYMRAYADQKLRTFVSKHIDLVDCMLTQDKLNIVLDELEELKETGQSLKAIEGLLPALDTRLYQQERPKYQNLEVLTTASAVKLAPNTEEIQVAGYDACPLEKLREEQREEMGAIMELNYRMLNNLNEKLRLAYQRKLKK